MPNSLFYVNPPPKLPFAMISWMANPPLQDTFFTQSTGGAYITFDPTGMQLVAQAAAADAEAEAYFSPLSMYYDLTFAKQRELKIDIDLEANKASLINFIAGWYPRASNKGAWIQLQESQLTFITQNASGQQQTTIETYDPESSLYRPIKIHLKHYPTSHTEVWIDEYQAVTHTQNIPAGYTTGVPEAYFLLRALYVDPDNGDARALIKYIELYQART